MTFNMVFVMGDIDNPSHNDIWILAIAILVNLIATGLKLGDRSQIGALLLAASLVADVLLISARVFWIIAESDSATRSSAEATVTIVSLAAGALAANIVSTLILSGDTLLSRR